MRLDDCREHTHPYEVERSGAVAASKVAHSPCRPVERMPVCRFCRQRCRGGTRGRSCLTWRDGKWRSWDGRR